MREKLTTTVHVRLPFETDQCLARLAEAQGLDKSKFVRQIVTQEIKKQKNSRPATLTGS